MSSKMEREKIDELLVEAGVGVLALTDGEEPYSIPESFGYDGESLYFQFVYKEDSKKMALIDTTETVCFTVFTEEPAQSVLVTGALGPVPEAEEAQAARAIAENANIPTLNVYPETAIEETSLAYYRLVPTEFSGREFKSFTSASVDS